MDDDLVKQLQLSRDDIRSLYDSFMLEFIKGLKMHRELGNVWNPDLSDLRMLDCHILNIPHYKAGTYYGIDVGGTSLKIARIEKTSERSFCNVTRELPLRQVFNMAKASTATQFFDTIAIVLKHFMDSEGDLSAKRPLTAGLSFSFAIAQDAIDSAIFVQWSKELLIGAEASDTILGKDICGLLNKSLAKESLPIRANCIINDAAATVLLGSLLDQSAMPSILAGVVLGTGFNVACLEPDFKSYGYSGQIINVEAGGLKHNLRLSTVDTLVDKASCNRGDQLLEKQVSGLYLTQIIGTVLDLLVNDENKSCRRTPLLEADYLGDIFDASVSDGDRLEHLTDQLFEKSAIYKRSNIPVAYIKTIVDAVYHRSATHLGIVVAAIVARNVNRQFRNHYTICVDGPIFKRHLSYRARVVETLNFLLGRNLADRVHLVTSPYSPAVAAAVLSSSLI